MKWSQQIGRIFKVVVCRHIEEQGWISVFPSLYRRLLQATSSTLTRVSLHYLPPIKSLYNLFQGRCVRHVKTTGRLSKVSPEGKTLAPLAYQFVRRELLHKETWHSLVKIICRSDGTNGSKSCSHLTCFTLHVNLWRVLRILKCVLT